MGNDCGVKRTSISVTNLEAASVDLEVIQLLIDILSSRVAQDSVSREDPNVFRMEHTTQQAVGTRVDNSVVSVVCVKNGSQGSLEGKTESVSDTVVTVFRDILDKSISVYCNWKSSPEITKVSHVSI